MAGLSDIVVGNFTKVFYAPDSMDATEATEEIENIQSLTQPTDTKNIVEVPQYNQNYQRKLAGSSTTGDAEIVVNFDPNLQSHIDLLDLYDSGERRKFRILVLAQMDGDAGSFYEFYGQVISKSGSSEFDAVTTVTFAISVDGRLEPWDDLPDPPPPV